MPKGPKGQKRSADVISNAVKVTRIATGEEADDVIDDGKNPAAKALGAKGGKEGRRHDAGAPRRDRTEGCGKALGKIASSFIPL